MSYHCVSPSLVDPVFDPVKPKAILYITGPGGNMRLMAVEYIVVNVGQAAPCLAISHSTLVAHHFQDHTGACIFGYMKTIHLDCSHLSIPTLVIRRNEGGTLTAPFYFRRVHNCRSLY